MTAPKERAWDKVRTIPLDAHPWVQMLFREMKAQGLSYGDINARTGLSEETLLSWRKGGNPRLDKIEMALRAVGVELWPIRIRQPEPYGKKRATAVEDIHRTLQQPEMM